jgi:hypothetical protein
MTDDAVYLVDKYRRFNATFCTHLFFILRWRRQVPRSFDPIYHDDLKSQVKSSVSVSGAKLGSDEDGNEPLIRFKDGVFLTS